MTEASSSAAAATATTTSVEEECGVVLYFGTTTWDIIGKRNPTEEKGAWSPHRLAPFSTKTLVKQVISGSAALHCIIIDADGHAHTWGRNPNGQLGHGDFISRGGPTLIDSLKGQVIVGGACGRHHTLFLAQNGTILSCGTNKFGQLGHGAIKEKNTSVSKPTLVPGLEEVKQVGCGADFSAAITQSGSMFTWGTPENGVLGHGTDGKYFITASKLTFDYQPAPVQIQQFVVAKAQIERFACGDQHTVAVDHQNRVWTWGFGGYGRLGHSEQRDEMKPKHLVFFGDRAHGGRDPSPIKFITAGSSSCYLVTTTGRTYFWGRTKPTGEATMYPKPVNDLSGWNVNAVGCGHTSTVVSADTSIITWGPTPTYGELGYGDPTAGGAKSSTQPKLVDTLTGFSCPKVASGFCQTLLIVRANTDEIKAKLEELPLLEPVECPFGQGADDEEEEAGGGASKRKPAAKGAPSKRGKSK